MKVKGMVYLVGAGPGDAGLLTLRGAELLARADMVVYDALVNAELLRLAPRSAEIIYGGKRGPEKAIPQEELNALADCQGARRENGGAAQRGRPLRFRAGRRRSAENWRRPGCRLKSCRGFRPSWPRRITPGCR